MIAHSDDFRTAVQDPVKTVRVKFYLHDNVANTDTPIFEGNEQSIESTYLGTFNNSGSQHISAKIIDNQVSQLNNLVKIDLEVKTDAIDWQTITLGYFVAYQIAYDIDTNVSTIDFYDQMYMLSLVPYALDDSLFPMTVATLAETIANLGEMTLDTNFSSLPNQDHVIPVNLWKTIQNIYFRDVINAIAQTTGTTAISSGKTLLFKQFNVVSEGLNETDLSKFQIGQKWGNVNSVVLSRQPQQDNVLVRNTTNAAANGIFEIEIDNNQIMDAERESMIVPIATYFGVDDNDDLTPYVNYYNSNLTIAGGYGWWEVGDVVTANLGCNDYPIFVTEIDLTVDGGITEVIQSITPDNPSVNKTTSGGILKTLYDTEIQVDKQNNVITSTVDQLNTYQDYVNNNFTLIQQEVDNITISVQDGGGVNKIKNSVGYSKDSSGNLNFWGFVS